MKGFFSLFPEAGRGFMEDKAPRLAAALAYYTIFSLAPLLVIVIGVLDMVSERLFPGGDAQERITDALSSALGPDAAGFVGTMVENVGSGGGGLVATLVGVVVLLFGATGVFAQLQQAMNEVWDVEPAPDAGGVLRIAMIRLRSLGMVLVIGFLLFVSFLAQAALEVLQTSAQGVLPGGDWIWQIVNLVVSLALLTLLFAAIYKVLPDVEISWRDVGVGAFVTALLFQLGKFLIGLYLGRAGPASAYGAAGSLVVILLWVYFSAQILLFGAEFTQAYARRVGTRIEPAPHAVRQREA